MFEDGSVVRGLLIFGRFGKVQVNSNFHVSIFAGNTLFYGSLAGAFYWAVLDPALKSREVLMSGNVEAGDGVPYDFVDAHSGLLPQDGSDNLCQANRSGVHGRLFVAVVDEVGAPEELLPAVENGDHEEGDPQQVFFRRDFGSVRRRDREFENLEALLQRRDRDMLKNLIIRRIRSRSHVYHHDL